MISLEQLMSAGLSARAVQLRAESGRLQRVHRGVYLVGPMAPTLKGRWTAAVMVCGPHAVLRGRSAAALRGLRRSPETAIHVFVPNRRGRRHEGLVVHGGAALAPADMTLVDGIPCTSVARTLLDLAVEIDGQGLRAAIRRAEELRIYDGREVAALLRRVGAKRGAGRLRQAAADPGGDRTRSELERRFLTFCRRHALPAPEVNVWLALEGRHVQADFLWRAERVIVETDGWQTHGTRAAFRSDRRRDQLLLRNGWRPTRATWDQLDEELARTIRALLEPAR